ncbi:2-phospho-L-lactate transferase, partial [Candidatus Bathyarchaeota archaeon]|nr:2-phospho-L-lactate transferase [Candidatus Bathyarchaeota archaeon]
GWGIRGDTFNCQKMLEKLGYETWFKLGDKDLATHIYRSQLLKKGLPLSVITKNLCGKFGVVPKIFPMTDNKVETKIKTPKGTMHFEEYHVKRQDRPRVLEVLFEGIEEANPAPRVVESIIKAEAVIICPSNPIVSIGTILSVNGIRAALKETKAKIAAVSPIIGGSPVKGPADKLMEGLGLEVTAFAVAESYKDFIDAFIIDEKDKEEKEKIERLKMDVTVTHSIMKSIEDKTRLARTTLGSIGIL